MATSNDADGPADRIEIANHQANPEYRHNVSESADKVRLETKVKRGSGTRDQDTVKVNVKGADPEATAERLAETLAALEDHGVSETLRETQPEGGE